MNYITKQTGQDRTHTTKIQKHITYAISTSHVKTAWAPARAGRLQQENQVKLEIMQ